MQNDTYYVNGSFMGELYDLDAASSANVMIPLTFLLRVVKYRFIIMSFFANTTYTDVYVYERTMSCILSENCEIGNFFLGGVVFPFFLSRLLLFLPSLSLVIFLPISL